MPLRLYNHCTPFSELARHRRRRMVRELEQKMLLANRNLGFYTHTQFEDDSNFGWCDVYFVGNDRFTLWNATVETATSVWETRIRDMALDEAFRRMTPEERRARHECRFEPADRSSTGKILTYRMIFPEDVPLESLGNSTYDQFVDAEEQRLRLCNPIQVYESFKILPKYAYGIGLNMIVDAESVTPNVIQKAIDRFKAGGEINWTSSVPAIVPLSNS